MYRKSYYYFDNIEDKDMFIYLKNRIENRYVNSFISELSISGVILLRVWQVMTLIEWQCRTSSITHILSHITIKKIE